MHSMIHMVLPIISFRPLQQKNWEMSSSTNWEKLVWLKQTPGLMSSKPVVRWNVETDEDLALRNDYQITWQHVKAWRGFQERCYKSKLHPVEGSWWWQLHALVSEVPERWWHQRQEYNDSEERRLQDSKGHGVSSFMISGLPWVQTRTGRLCSTRSMCSQMSLFGLKRQRQLKTRRMRQR